ncbi:MAG: EamA family transporter, partial [Patescibacteria group bacterium]
VFARLFYVLPILVVYMVIKNAPLPPIHPWFPYIAIVLAFFEVPAHYCYQRAIKTEKTSLVNPIYALITIPMMSSFIFFEGWSIVGFAGIVVITGGVYILQARKNNYAGGNVLLPIISLWQNKESRLMLYAVMCWSITTPLQKVAIKMSNIEMMGLCYLSIASLLTVLWGIFKGSSVREIIFPQKVHHFAPIGLVAGINNVLQYTALSLINPAYVTGLKQTIHLWLIVSDRFIFKDVISKAQMFAIGIIVTGAMLVGLGVK